MTPSHNEPCQTTNWSVGDAPLSGDGIVAAIGNFDGVHRGHQQVIAAAIAAARSRGLDAAAITFDPHPREFFRHDEAAFHLADRAEKDRLLAALGLDRIIHVTFDEALRSTDAERFVTEILPALGVRSLYAGADFAFGRGRGGDIDSINALGANLYGANPNGDGIGIDATGISLLADDNSAVVSSSRVRAALQAGEPEQAAEMLGHDWAITGVVQQGDQRGRTIGFPTANIPLGNLLHPAFGVYAVQIFSAEPGSEYHLLGNGVANIGIRPTVEDRGVLCEAHIFDQQIDLYGQRLAVTLKSFIRPERKFSGIDELTDQIARDAEAARTILPQIRQTA